MPPPPLVPIAPVAPIVPVPVYPEPLIDPIVTDAILLPPAVVIHEGREWRVPGRPYGWRQDRGGPRESFGRGSDHRPMH
jgi:hypothetical protein